MADNKRRGDKQGGRRSGKKQVLTRKAPADLKTNDDSEGESLGGGL